MTNLQRPTNALLKTATSLKQKKYRKLERLSTAEGFKLLEEAIDAGIPIQSAYFIQKAIDDQPDLLQKYISAGIECYRISPSEMERMSPLKTPPGCLIVYSTEYEIEPKSEGIILGIHKISDPGNLGAILRTAEWFGVSRVLLAPESAELHNPSTVRGSMGAVFRLPIKEDVDLEKETAALKKKGYSIVIPQTRGGTSPHPVEGKTAFFIGDEQGNMPADILTHADEFITIPRYGSGGESLNIGIACGIMLYALTGDKR